jgi:hypothetical protein
MRDPQRTKGIILHAMRLAVLDLWGEPGLNDIAARISEENRKDTVDHAASPLEWLPERYLVEWHEASWNGPAKHDDEALCRVINRRLDYGFGRVRRALLGLVGPEGVIRRAGELWKHDHTHGSLAVKFDAKEQAVAGTLSDHLFCEVPIARRAITESLRYIVQLSRGVKKARATYAMRDKALNMTISWE